MKTLTILATGFAQPQRLSNGLAAARAAILEKNPSSKVFIHSWKDYEHVPGLASMFATMDHDRIVMAGHSYGCWLLAMLADEMWKEHRSKTDALLSADGVERGNPRKGTLTISPGVENVYSWYQTKGIIKGSEIIVTPPTKLVQTEVHVIHPRVDETPEFQAKLLEFATGGA